VLSKTYLFQDLDPDQINFISALLEKEMFVAKDNVILHEGDSGNNRLNIPRSFLDTSLYLIERGSVRLVRMDDQKSPRELMRLGVGQLFGELSLITGLPRTCSVIANEDSVLLELKKESFDRLMRQYQNMRIKLALLVEQRLRENVSIKAEMETPRGTSRINKL
jgi:CRP-like cAMP-binding protein